MKLELKHLAPYLPYDLGILVEMSMTETDSFPLTTENIDGVLEYQKKPTLRPLDDLVNEITHNGQKFVPIVELLKMQYISWQKNKEGTRYAEIEHGKTGTRYFALYTNQATYSFKLYKYEFMTGRNTIEYWVMQKLIEWHFDVFDLIEQNLAVDFNKIQNTP